MSSYYDSLIKYWEKNSWRKYFEEDIGKLCISCGKVLALWYSLKSEIDQRDLQEILKKDLLQKVMLGGLKEDGTFDENGLAIFFKRLFGTKISDEEEFVMRLKAGMPLNQAASQIKGSCAQTKFLELTSKIYKGLKNVTSRASAKGFSIGVEEKAVETVKSVEEVCDGIKEFLEACISISPNYNPYSFFISSLFRITRKYMELAYPKLREEENFNFIKDLFDLSEILTPRIHDEKLKRDYTVWGYKKDSIGYEVMSIIKDTWDLIELEEARKYFSVTNERELYTKKAFEALERIKSSIKEWEDVKDALSKYIIIYNRYSREGHHVPLIERVGFFSLKPTKGFAKFGYSQLKGLVLKIGEKSLPFTTFMDYISPQLFLNIAYLDVGRISPDGEIAVKWEAPI